MTPDTALAYRRRMASKPSARELRRAFGPRAVAAFDAHEHVIVELANRVLQLEQAMGAWNRDWRLLVPPSEREYAMKDTVSAIERHGEAVV